ncbi:MAG: histidinol phosphatase [Ferruginibacter sp.]
MLSFFKKTSPTVSDYFPIQTDMHSHILPGIDDGSPDIETSLLLIKGLMELGLKRSVATPHVISDVYRNTPATIRAALQQLQSALAENNIDYKVKAAAEYMMDAAFFEMIEKGEELLCIKDKTILTEFSFGSLPDNPRLMSFSIITAGYTPILAHPERYAYFHGNPKAYHLLDELGFQLQVNLSSLTGYYGGHAEKAAKYILKNKLCRYIGTDLHHVRHLELLKKDRAIFETVLEGARWNESLNEAVS